jgi:hypothetical protein
MYAIMRVKAGKASSDEEKKTKETRWEELRSVMELLEKRLGWEMVDGTKAYTSDKDPSHKSMVLGESCL